METLDIWDMQLVDTEQKWLEAGSFIEEVDQSSLIIHYKLTGGKEHITLSYDSVETLAWNELWKKNRDGDMK